MAETTPESGPRKQAKKSKGPGFQMMLVIFASLTIVVAGILWEVYGYVPAIYYMPVSIGVVIVYGVLAYVFLSRTINIS